MPGCLGSQRAPSADGRVAPGACRASSARFLGPLLFFELHRSPCRRPLLFSSPCAECAIVHVLPAPRRRPRLVTASSPAAVRLPFLSPARFADFYIQGLGGGVPSQFEKMTDVYNESSVFSHYIKEVRSCLLAMAKCFLAYLVSAGRQCSRTLVPRGGRRCRSLLPPHHRPFAPALCGNLACLERFSTRIIVFSSCSPLSCVCFVRLLPPPPFLLF